MRTRRFQVPAYDKIIPFASRLLGDGLEPMDKFDAIRRLAVANIGTTIWRKFHGR